jgi:serine phosphatase RsbU (regulator of sigma subunit)/streptogramin lyase
VRSITEDKSGNLWFGTYGGGVSKYDGKSFETFSTSQGLANNFVLSITEDKSGNLWFGTEGGVALLPKSSELAMATKLHPKGSKSNTPFAQVMHTQGFITISTANGLPDDFITQILQGADGKIYIGTNYGIASFDVPTKAEIREYYANLQNISTKSQLKLKNLEIYNSATHYPVKDVNAGQNCMYQDSKGIIWAGTGSDKTALVRFDPKAVNKTSNPPTTYIQSIKVLGENVCWFNQIADCRLADCKLKKNKIDSDSIHNANDSLTLLLAQFKAFGKTVSQDILDSQYVKFKDVQFDGISKWFPLPQNLVLPFKYNSISFDYLANELSRNHLVRYQYMLEGQDENWSPITAKNDVSYTNLFEGNYSFKIKAQFIGVGNNEWSEVTTYDFKVLPPWYRTWWMYTVYGLLATGLIVLIVWWNGRKLRERAKLLTEEVRKATVEIRNQKEEIEDKQKVLEQTHEKLAEHHKEITDSINYAERIQKSFLATKELLDANLCDYFVFFRPKDVVSGDFYWASKLKNNNFSFCCADSTGHGVPGAIMSILNISSLEKSIENETEPNLILNQTRKIIIERLKKDGSPEGGKDGMDCSLLVLNPEKTVLTFSAANNPVIIIRNNEIVEFKADKMPVGKHDRDTVSFTLQELELQKGDVIYALTDGFPDQFGGDKGKKYMIKNLKNFFLLISNLSMQEQEQKLANEFDSWKQSAEQIDDVCIIGVRV